MRILTAGPALWLATGYGTQLRMLVQSLRAAGHDVAHFAFAGMHGGSKITYGDVMQLPGDGTTHGNRIVHPHVAQYQPDFVLSLCDTWALTGWGEPQWPLAAWSPIDHDGCPIRMRDVLRNQVTWPLAMSDHGAAMMRSVAVEPAARIHLGISPAFFVDADAGKRWRQVHQIPPRAYLCGLVGLNTWWPDRKGINRLLLAFRQALDGGGAFARPPEEGGAALYLHTTLQSSVSDDAVTFDLTTLIPELGLRDRVWHTDAYTHALSLDADGMRALYNSLDVFVLPTMGEGFGVPVVEAQRCGVPVIATDCTSMPELVKTGQLIRVEGRIYTMGYAFQSLASIDHLAELLRQAHGGSLRDVAATEVAERVADFGWDQVWATQWDPFLQQLPDALVERRAGWRPVHAPTPRVFEHLPPRYRLLRLLTGGRTPARLALVRDSAPLRPEFADCVVKIQERTADYPGPGPLTQEAQITSELTRALLEHGLPWELLAMATPLDMWEDSAVTAYTLPRYETTLARVPRLSYADAQRVWRRLEATVDGLRQLGWAHRDLVPENVLLRRTQAGLLSAALCDFAWAKYVGGPEVTQHPDYDPTSALVSEGVRQGRVDAGIHTLRRALFEKTYPEVLPLLQAQGATGRSDQPYQQVFGWGERDCATRWQQLDVDVAGKRVLDLGCNLGLFGREAELAGAAAYTGVDGDPSIITAAKIMAQDWHDPASSMAEPVFLAGDGTALDGSMQDIGLALGLVMHVDRHQLYDTMRRCAAVWYLEVPHAGEYQYRWGAPEWLLDLRINALHGSLVGRSERNRPILCVQAATSAVLRRPEDAGLIAAASVC